MGRINIKKISEMAGVSTTAVSFVLNNKKGVSEETRKRILDIIERENYTPNVNSRRLILKRSFNIFLVLDDDISKLENLFYSALINVIVRKAHKLGYNVVLSLKTGSFEKSPLLQAIKQNNADGVIFLQDIDNETVYELKKIKIPYVIIDSQKANPEYVCVKSDYELSSYVATKYLIDCGHKRIAFIGMSKIPDYYITSFNGYKKAISEHSLSFYPEWIQGDAYDNTSAYNCMKNILSSQEIPTAVFCAGDILAIGAMNCAYDMGYKVPYDISFTSIDNIAAAEYCRPSLTTIDIDKVEMGEKAIELLDAQINNNLQEKIHVVKSDKIIVRDSVRNLNV